MTSFAADATFAVSDAQLGWETPYISANRMEPDCAKLACEASAPLNATTEGKRFGADQNEQPLDVLESSGNVYVSWAILL